MRPSAQQRTALGWISVAAAALALVTGRWWLLAVTVGVWWWSRGSSSAPRLSILPGGISTSGAVADALWNPAGQLPGLPEPNYEPTSGPGEAQGGGTESTGGRGATCAGL